VAISLVTPADLETVRSVERLIGRPLERPVGAGGSGQTRPSPRADRPRSGRPEGAPRRRPAPPPPARPAVATEKPGLLRRVLDHLGARRGA
jgi:hypothetical protein